MYPRCANKVADGDTGQMCYFPTCGVSYYTSVCVSMCVCKFTCMYISMTCSQGSWKTASDACLGAIYILKQGPWYSLTCTH